MINILSDTFSRKFQSPDPLGMARIQSSYDYTSSTLPTLPDDVSPRPMGLQILWASSGCKGRSLRLSYYISRRPHWTLFAKGKMQREGVIPKWYLRHVLALR